MRHLPTGRVTFLFTDIEGSTRLLHELGAEGYAAALTEHRRIVREAFARHGGVEVDTQGDAFFVAFASAADAIAAAEAAQRAVGAGPIQMRVGIHTGEPVLTGDGYVGIDVHRAARICAVAHGGQVVVSASTRAALDSQRADGIVDLGLHRLKDLTEAERLYQLGNRKFPPLRSLNATNLPVQPNPLIGRWREVGEVVELARDGFRAVTLTGPGGSGKTRLGVQAAAELVPDFPDGVFWVPLAPLHDPRLVIPAAEQALGAKVPLVDHIDERRMLLLFDNFEQVADAAADLAGVLGRCPYLKVLATSRAPLRIAGEREYPVEPLPESDAVELFHQRAAVAEPIDAVHEICRRLDGLPLAVELAAARTRLLPPDKLLARLDRRLSLLAGGQRDAPERQRTLRATIEWSHDLLAGDERALFARLAAFRGGFTVEAAEAICNADIVVLESLVEKSLLRRLPGGRLGMLETIREYAAERLDASAEAEDIKRRHAEYFLALAKSAGLDEDGLPGSQHRRVEIAAAEIENMRAALGWASESDPELGLRLAMALTGYWVPNTPAEGRQWINVLLDKQPHPPPELHARAVRALGGLTYIQGEFDEGNRLHEASLEEFRQLGDELQVGLLLVRRGVEALRTHDLAGGRSAGEEALTICRRYGSQWGEAQALYVLADVAFEEGRHDEAFELMQQSAALAADVGFVWWQVGALDHLAEFALRQKRLADASRFITTGLRLAVGIGDRQSTVWFLSHTAWLSALGKQRERAGRMWGAIEAEEKRGRIGQWEDQRDDYAKNLAGVAGPEFEAARLEGHGMTLDEAVAFALASLESGAW